MKGKKRSELALEAFRADEGPRALMLPIKTGSHGLNLVRECPVAVDICADGMDAMCTRPGLVRVTNTIVSGLVMEDQTLGSLARPTASPVPDD